MGDELELKYTVDDLDAIVAFLDEQLPPAIGYGWRTLDVTDTYFDTEAHALARAGYGARLRRHGLKRIVGLKSDLRSGRRAGHAQRDRGRSDGRSRSVDLAAQRGARHRAQPCPARPLVTRFVLRQRQAAAGLRRARAVGRRRVSVRRGRKLAGELKELEVEYKSGRRSELQPRREVDREERPGPPEPRSKMVLAAAMVEGAPSIYPGDALAESGRKVLGRLLERLVERDQTMREGDTVALKQMRVTTRRMRAAWRSFAPALPAARRKPLRGRVARSGPPPGRGARS